MKWEIGTGSGLEFNDESYKNRGSYTVMLLPISDAHKVNLASNDIRDHVI